MKILIINYRLHFTGGPERYMFNITEDLRKRGHQIIHFSVKNAKNVKSDYEKYFPRNIGNSNEFLFEKFKKNPLFYYDYITRQFYSFYIKRKLDKLIKITKPDICYLLQHVGSLSPSVIDALIQNDIPIVHRISDYNIICPQVGLYRNRVFCNQCKDSIFSVVKFKCVKNSYVFSIIKFVSFIIHKRLRLYDKIDHFITTNEFAKKQFLEFGFDQNKISTIETYASNICNSKRKKIDYPIKYIYVGNIDDSKGAFDLMEAVKGLKTQYNEKQFTLNIYGGLRDYEREKINDFIKRNQLNKIIFLNSVISSEEVSNIYQKSDVTIIPARWVENLPNVLIESLSNGNPIVVPNFGSFSSVVNESVAYFFKPYDAFSLRDVLKYIIDNPETIIEKSIEGLAYANTRFNKEIHISKLIALFEKYRNHENY